MNKYTIEISKDEYDNYLYIITTDNKSFVVKSYESVKDLMGKVEENSEYVSIDYFNKQE